MTTELPRSDILRSYRCPLRSISFDGFVSYEGRRFGVPFSYTKRRCRVERQDFNLVIYSNDFKEKLATHDVTWSRRDSFCEGQYSDEQPMEQPAPVKASMTQTPMKECGGAFERFNFAREVCWNE